MIVPPLMLQPAVHSPVGEPLTNVPSVPSGLMAVVTAAWLTAETLPTWIQALRSRTAISRSGPLPCKRARVVADPKPSTDAECAIGHPPRSAAFPVKLWGSIRLLQETNVNIPKARLRGTGSGA